MPEPTDLEIVRAAVEAGFVLTTACGQQAERRMPVSDVATLRAFWREMQRQEQPHG